MGQCSTLCIRDTWSDLLFRQTLGSSVESRLNESRGHNSMCSWGNNWGQWMEGAALSNQTIPVNSLRNSETDCPGTLGVTGSSWSLAVPADARDVDAGKFLLWIRRYSQWHLRFLPIPSVWLPSMHHFSHPPWEYNSTNAQSLDCSAHCFLSRASHSVVNIAGIWYLLNVWMFSLTYYRTLSNVLFFSPCRSVKSWLGWHVITFIGLPVCDPISKSKPSFLRGFAGYESMEGVYREERQAWVRANLSSGEVNR